MLDFNQLVVAIKNAVDVSGEATIKYCDDQEMQALNHQFRGLNKPTNVLSFPVGDAGYLGDIAISLPTIKREAKAQGKTVDAHLAHMIVHGVLHLLGYDHENDAEAEAMEALEIEILKSVGISNPYEYSG